MPKIKYDVSNVEDASDLAQAPVGIYRAKVAKVDGPKPSSNGNPMLEVQFHLTHSADGKKLKQNEYGDVWFYPILEHDHPFVQSQLKMFLLAFGLKPKGQLDTDKLVGQTVQVKLGSDTDQDGDYRPRIKKIMAMADDASEDDTPEDDAEPEDATAPEPDEEEEEDDDEESIDLAELDRAALKKLIKEEELDIKVLKSMSDDDLRTAIAEAMGGDEEEEGDDDEEEEEPAAAEEDEDDGYDGMSINDLKAELKERSLATAGAKKVLIARLRKDDATDPF